MLQINPQGLARHLTPLRPIYWIGGEEPLLVQECCEQFRQQARQQGYSERQVFYAERQFDWQELATAEQNLSLFAERKLVEIHLNGDKVPEPGRPYLQSFAAAASEDTCLLLISGKIDNAALKTKWLKSIGDALVLVQCYPIRGDQMRAWVSNRLKQMQLKAEPQAIQLLADRFEGNLLAAAQELQKLQILAPQQSLDAARVEDLIADHARYDPFQLIDTVLLGHSAKAIKMLSQLKAEGLRLDLLIGAWARALRELLSLRLNVQQGRSPQAAMQQARIWSSRKPALQAALTRLSVNQCRAALQRLHRLDQWVKRGQETDAWLNLSALILSLAQPQTFAFLQSDTEIVTSRNN